MIDLTAKIVAAYVRNNSIATSDIGDLVRAVHNSLSATMVEQPIETQPAAPAVSIRKSVAPAEITCLDCGKKFAMLKRHLRTDHGITPEEYRTKWSLPASYPMVAPDYAATRSALAKKAGLGLSRKKAG